MSADTEAVVRRAFDSAVEIARKQPEYRDDETTLTLRLCSFFGAIAASAGMGDVPLDVLEPVSSSGESR